MTVSRLGCNGSVRRHEREFTITGLLGRDEHAQWRAFPRSDGGRKHRDAGSCRTITGSFLGARACRCEAERKQ